MTFDTTVEIEMVVEVDESATGLPVRLSSWAGTWTSACVSPTARGSSTATWLLR